jgi:glycyl-tRNA synthetase beta subunit
VNAEDAALRRNRLALLAQLREQFTRIADLSCLPG